MEINIVTDYKTNKCVHQKEKFSTDIVIQSLHSALKSKIYTNK